jgi:hypothetical protein
MFYSTLKNAPAHYIVAAISKVVGSAPVLEKSALSA